MIFAAHSAGLRHLRDSHGPSVAYGGMPKAIGRGRTTLLSRTKAPRARGCTPTWDKASSREFQIDSMVGQANLFAQNITRHRIRPSF